MHRQVKLVAGRPRQTRWQVLENKTEFPANGQNNEVYRSVIHIMRVVQGQVAMPSGVSSMGWLHLGCGGMVRCHHVRVAQRGPAERRSLGMEAFELVTAHVWEAMPSGQIWGVRGGRDGHLVHGRLVKSLVGGTVAYRVKDVLSVG